MATTYDGVEVRVGLRVFTNDWAWGTVVKVCGDRYTSDLHHDRYHQDVAQDCWHEVDLDSGRNAIYNQERMTTTPPPGAPADPRA